MKKPLLIFLVVHLIVTQPAMIVAQGADVLRGVRKDNRSTDVQSFGTGSRQPVEDEKVGIGSIPVGGPGQQGAIYYNTHILGAVNRPGTYKVLPSDRLTDGIKYAGGIAENGSQSAIQLRRMGATQVLDLFLYKYGAVLSQNPYLIENDVIFVPLKKGEFDIEGPVGRPGKYEILRPVNLAKAVATAGGFTVGRSLADSIRVIRYDESEKKQILEIENTDAAMERFDVQKGDIIVVPHVLIADKKFDYNIQRLPGDNIFYPTINDNVYVAGAVSMPGPYGFQPSFSVSNYVSQAGPSDHASIKRVKIISPNGKKRTAKKTDQINPGDTIVVPSKAITASNFISWFGTLTSMALTTFIFVDRFAK